MGVFRGGFWVLWGEFWGSSYDSGDLGEFWVGVWVWVILWFFGCDLIWVSGLIAGCVLVEVGCVVVFC